MGKFPASPREVSTNRLKNEDKVGYGLRSYWLFVLEVVTTIQVPIYIAGIKEAGKNCGELRAPPKPPQYQNTRGIWERPRQRGRDPRANLPPIL